MTHVDLHPDELLDPARLRTLTPSERERLDRHLAGCAACAFELAATQDFCRVLETKPPAEDAAVARVIEKMWSRLGAADGMPIARRTVLPRARWGRRALLVAAILAVAAGAGAAGWYFGIAPLLRDEPRPAARPAPTGGVGPSEPAPAPSQTHSVAPPHRPIPPRADPSVPPLPPIIARPPSPQPAPAQERRHAHAPPAPPALPVPPPAAPVAAATLFAEANDVRRAGSYAEAVELYRKLQAGFPTSGEAVVSRVTLGRLLLDRMNDAAGALAQFDAYLVTSPGGTLGEDALAGRALALQRLGRADEERAAWTELLVRFPGSAHAARAQERLAQPGPPTEP